MQAAQTAGQEVLANDMGVFLDHGVVQVQHVPVVFFHGAVVHLVPAHHAPEGMGPGYIIRIGPKGIPFLEGMGFGMKIRMASFDILHLLGTKGPVKTFSQCLAHTKLTSF